MNAVGNIGQFIIDNQYTIEVALLILLALLIVVFLISRLVSKRKRDAEIEELNAKIEKIESEVKGISDQTVEAKNVKIVLKTDEDETVIEASGLMANEDEEIDIGESQEATEEEIDPEKEIDKAELQKAIDSLDEIMAEIKNSDLETNAEPEISDVGMVGSKFTSRDWNKDRKGNTYTEEMLKELIG